MVPQCPCLFNWLCFILLFESFDVSCLKNFTRPVMQSFLTQHLLLFYFSVLSTINQTPIGPQKCIILFKSLICYVIVE
jgi:hypothetical protein